MSNRMLVESTDRMYRPLFLLLQAAAVAVLLGRGWQHFFWDAPYRALLWDESLLKGLVEGVFGTPWREYVTDPANDRRISLFIRILGIFYFLCALLVIWISRVPMWLRRLLWVASFSLAILAWLYSMDKFLHLGQFLEYSLQVGAPLFIYVAASRQRIDEPLAFWMRLATSVTFISHGLYAFGFYQVPGNFMTMVISILGVSDGVALQFLKAAGFLDFVVAVLIWLPGKWRMAGLYYCVLWGAATSFARVWAYFVPEFWLESLHQWLHETVMRFPHFLIPLALLLLERRSR